MNTSYHLHLMRRFLETFRDEEVALFPNPGNAGDSLIAAGTYQALRRAGIRYSILQPGQNVTGRTVFLGGGGNLVPLYRECRDTLEAVLPSARRIVVLPHTIRGNEDLLARLDERATVFCRDPQSYWHVLQHCQADVRLDHDMAFHLNIDDFFTQCVDYEEMPAVFAKRIATVAALTTRQRQPLAFMREDGEKSPNLSGIDSALDLSTAFEFGVVPDTAEKSAWCMFQAIRRSSHCTTDRLHVAIACALMDHPCRLFDNNYGKNSGIYLHSMRRFSSAVTLVKLNGRREGSMSVAILALAFREPAVLAAAVPVYRAAGCDIYVHLDAKVPVADYKAAMGPMAQECTFLAERRSIYWAGFTMVRAMLDLMGAALAGGSYRNFALVSDDSFPLRAPWLLKTKLTTDHQRIAARRIDENELFAQRYRRFFYFDHQATSLHGRPIESACVDDRLLVTMQRLAARRHVGKADLPLFYGSQWWSLTEAAVRLIIELDATRDDLRESFEFSAVPDEMYFQSLLMSFAPDMKRVESPMLVDWTRQPKPFVFQKFDDIQSRISEDHCFVRKVSARQPELLEQLRLSVLSQEMTADLPREAGAA